jgi:hypothetical protein
MNRDQGWREETRQNDAECRTTKCSVGGEKEAFSPRKIEAGKFEKIQENTLKKPPHSCPRKISKVEKSPWKRLKS